MLRSIMSLYVCLIEQSYLSSNPHGRAQAGGIVAQMRDYKFVATLVLFEDVLDILCHTCRIWQAGNLDLSAVSDTLKLTIAQVHSLKSKPVTHWTDRADKIIGDVTAKVRAHADTVLRKEDARRLAEKKAIIEYKQAQAVLAQEAEERGEDFKQHAYKKEKMKGNLMQALKAFEIKSDKANWDKAVRQAWLSAVEDNLRARFPDDKFLTAFDMLFNPARFPAEYDADYGKIALRTLTDHYGVERGGQAARISAEGARQQWPVFYWSMREAVHNAKQQDAKNEVSRMQSMLAVVLRNSHTSQCCRELVYLAETALAYSPQTVPCESGFSHVKLAKNPLRSCLGDDLLNAAMFAVFEGPDNPDDFDSAEAVRWWHPLKQRRLPITNIAACKGRPPSEPAATV